MADDRGAPRRRQSDIARAAGVSQATVSMVLNGRTGRGAAIRPETRERVLAAAAELGYAGNPAARSLAGGRNRLLGVFTFESVFPAESADFYHPFLVGVERAAEAEGYDLILFTSAAGPDGRRRIYRDNFNRLRMADGCVLLGYERDRSELDRLAGEDFPFVVIGRRDVPGRDVAYVAADYTTPTAEAVGRLAALGHHAIAYLGSGLDAEHVLDREEGYRQALAAHGLDPDPRLYVSPARSLRVDDLHGLRALGATAFLTEDDSILRRLLELTSSVGLHAPDDFSLVTLVDPSPLRPDADVSGLRVPRLEMGAAAVRMLGAMLSDSPEMGAAGADGADGRRLVLPCDFAAGTTTGPPPSPRPSSPPRPRPSRK
ncbi:LacI family DNA-binding transcriptional regulator [Actinopolymorpha sp. B17G11]|uniref:LacI family DNA-binding transcriptional regulator n=1 Tax=unclassified Actinopolymorpha TaxID=2627063 RepID=UPI0032D9667F